MVTQQITAELPYGLFSLTKTVVGIARRPYETVRSAVDRANLSEVFWIWALVFGYFGMVSVVKIPAFRPFLLTRQFLALSSGFLSGFFLNVLLLYTIGKRFCPDVSWKKIFVGWGYTMVPTIGWFFFTSLLYVILPPPRTTQWSGMLFSFWYLLVSTVLLFWKLMLWYLAIRFSLRISAPKILLVCLLSLPFLVGYSYLMYQWGIFRIPFL